MRSGASDGIKASLGDDEWAVSRFRLLWVDAQDPLRAMSTPSLTISGLERQGEQSGHLSDASPPSREAQRVKGHVGVCRSGDCLAKDFVRGLGADGAPAVPAVDQSRGVAEAAPGGAGCPRRGRGGGLVVRDHRRGQRPGEKGGPLTGPNPVDRGKAGSKIHVISDAAGGGARRRAATPGQAPARSRAGHGAQPVKLRADKGYDFDADRRWLRQRGIIPRIARRGIDTSERLGRHRQKIERILAWFTGYRRLTIRYERKASLYGAFLSLAATLICWKKLPT